MPDIDPDTCEHEYELAKAEQTPKNQPNVAHFVCKHCGNETSKRTLKSVATIKTECAEASDVA